ncbi:metal ABC transporter substrate-binding protein [Engelhardtia mirabilis]|uniref:metal ABC transporter substrate-binding protein n=1 Tax=Engelhardtia mirabilis TaxID=2528011 RepID=UPI0011A9426A
MTKQQSILLALAHLALAGLAAATPGADEPLRVLATVKDLGSIASEIGGDRVEVTSIARGTENVHSVAIRPSVLVAANRADVFLEIGLSLEHAWVPGLLERARNARIQPGAPGFCNASVGFEAIEVPDAVDRGRGVDIHPEGNPHLNLDPAAGRHFAGRILATLVAVDPQHREDYELRHARYIERLDVAEARWRKALAPLAGQVVVTYHSEFNYLLRAAGVESAAVLEPKPGIPPTPAHLAEVIQLMRDRDVRTVLTAKWSNGRSVRKVADAVGGAVVELPTMAGGVEGADTWIASMDAAVGALVAALAPVEEGSRAP